ncbi:MAG: hypothetical protein QOG33_916, partial [Gaiellales bacterium]|nr:hypothetical protein [Gaiellales bacterium]
CCSSLPASSPAMKPASKLSPAPVASTTSTYGASASSLWPLPTSHAPRGPRGAWLLGGGQRLEAEAPSVDVVDATGAGDSFDAGFIAGLLAGRELQQCLRLACVCGALSTGAAGGTAGQPTLDVADAQQ